MKRIDPVVAKETLNIAIWSVILSAVMQAVFLIIGKWDLTVLFGNILGTATSVLNFFIMALGVQIALEKEEREARQTLRLSQSMRFIFLFAVVAIGAALSVFNVIAVAIPLLFPRVAIFMRMFFINKDVQPSEVKEDVNES